MEGLTIYLIATLVHIIIWCVIYRLHMGYTDVFDPFYLISALYIMIFVFGPWVWISRGQTSYQGIEIMAYLPKGTFVFDIGYFFYGIGSYSKRNTRFVLGNRSLNNTMNNEVGKIDYQNELIRRYIVRYATVVFIISMALSLLYYKLIGRSLLSLLTFGNMGETLEGREASGLYFLKCFFRSAIPAAIMMVSFSRRKVVPWLCAIVLSIICISTGSRNLAITVILSIFIYQNILKKKRPKIFTLVLLIAGFYLLIGIVGIFRGAMKASAGMDFSQVNSDALFDAFMYNAEIFYPFYNLVEYIPKYANYHYGLGILNIVVQFIPRALWPGKPTMLGKTAFEAMYGDSMGGAAYPNIGEFYYEFGIVGVIVFMFAYGRIMQGVYYKAMQKKDKLSQLMFAINFGYIIQFVCRGHFASWAIDYVFMLGPIVLLKYLLRKKYNEG